MKVNIHLKTKLTKANATEVGSIYSHNSFLYLRIHPSSLLQGKMPENTILFLNIGAIGAKQSPCCTAMLSSHLDMEYVGEAEIKLA